MRVQEVSFTIEADYNTPWLDVEAVLRDYIKLNAVSEAGTKTVRVSQLRNERTTITDRGYGNGRTVEVDL